MSIFKEHKTQADRSVSDRRRHKQKIDKAIKEGITDIVADESIIGQNGKKKIKIPVRGIKQYKFVYGDNDQRSVGSGGGEDISRGQKINKPGKQGQQPGEGGQPGNEAGEEFYEVEITHEELAHYLFDSLELPELEKKAFQKLVQEKPKRKGYRNQGIRPRLDKKETVKKMIKRRNIARRNGEFDNDEDFPFRDNDLRYKHIKQQNKPHSNAVIFFVMDISGSMTRDKKYLARSFFFLLYHFIRSKYEHTDLVFLAHDTNAYEVNEEQFFSRGSSGGTLVSSALVLVNEIIEKRYHPDSWNIYLFQCSDGDNWSNDNPRVVNMISKIQKYSQFIGYCEIEPTDERLKWVSDDSKLFALYARQLATNIRAAKIIGKKDVWPAFKKFFGGKLANV